MRQIFIVLLSAAFLAGCVSASTIESRKQAHAAVYASFSTQIKTLVDQGQIAVGLTPDAVDVAWRSPDEVLQNGNPNGVFMVWIYRGSFLQDIPYWAGRCRNRDI